MLISKLFDVDGNNLVVIKVVERAMGSRSDQHDWIFEREGRGQGRSLRKLMLSIEQIASHILIGVILLCSNLFCSCSTTSSQPIATESSFVRNLGYDKTPEMQAMAEQVHQIANEMYPKVCSVLSNNETGSPRQFDITLEKKLLRGSREPGGETVGTRIRLNATLLSRCQWSWICV